MATITETEISIKTPLNGSISCEKYPRTIIVYYENDTRISNNIQQSKQVLRKDTFLKWHKNRFLPCTHTVSTETNITSDLFSSNIKKIVTRHTLYNEMSIRITLDYENHNFYLNGETEDIQIADKFYDVYCEYLDLYIQNTTNYYDTFPITSYNRITSRKFEIFNIGDNVNCIGVKYKYDGYKTKLIITDNSEGYYLAPSVNIIQKVTIPEELSKFNKFVLQLETMSNNIIITDVIGVYINNVLYAPNPGDVLDFFRYLNLNTKHLTIEVEQHTYRLYTQHDMFERGPIDCYDGYIFVTRQHEYKVKLPTVDLHLIRKFFYVYEGEKKIQVGDHQYPFEDGIYEVIRHPRDHDGLYRFIVLRQRFDRHYPCSKTEYDKFIENNKKWADYFRKHPITCQ